MLLDRRDAEYLEQRQARQGNAVADLAAGRIGVDTFRVVMRGLGFDDTAIADLAAEYRPFKTLGQVAAGFVSGLPEKQR